MLKHQQLFTCFLLATICLLLILLSLFIGEIHFSHLILFQNLLGQGDDLQRFILLHLRIPHIMNTFVVGSLLALSGYLMQAAFSNPLADPYTLGTTGGAALFTLLGMILGFENLGLLGCSFLGTLFSLTLLFISVRDFKHVSSSRLLLTGVMLAAGWGAMLSLTLLLSPSLETKPILYWLFGNVDNNHLPAFGFIILTAGLCLSLLMFNELSLLSQGKILARTLGVDTEILHLKTIILSSLLTACAVSLGGTIGFIGLVVPHLTRLLLKSNHILLIPCTVLMGGALLLLADILARIITAPAELPIGIVTTLLGIPFFLLLASKTND